MEEKLVCWCKSRVFLCDWIQADDELLARKLQEQESASLRNKSRKVSKPVRDVNALTILAILLGRNLQNFVR